MTLWLWRLGAGSVWFGSVLGRVPFVRDYLARRRWAVVPSLADGDGVGGDRSGL